MSPTANNTLKHTNQLSNSYIFLTGATGLVGQYLIRDLLLQGYRLALLTRRSERMTAHERIERIMQDWEAQLGQTLPRPIVLTGDVNEPNLGLSDKDVRWLSSNCNTAIHNAAILTFHGSDRTQEPWRTNLGGTKNFVELSKKAGIRNWHYVSTAYVCGQREGKIHEDELDLGQSFRNDYEESKLSAEKLIQSEADGFAKLTIFRPAVIVGDSKTGYTCSYHGLFLYLRLIATLVPQQPRDENGVLQTPITLSITGNEPRNLVAVDWVSAVITQIIGNSEAHGKTFHLSPDTFVTARNVINYCYDYFNSTGVVYAGLDNHGDQEKSSNFAETFFSNSQIYESYQTEDPDFDRTNLLEYAGNIPCPKIDRELIFKFIEFGENDRWGKRRPIKPEVPCWFGEQLMSISQFNFLDPVKKAFLGIDIHGKGGGQWQLVIDGKSRTMRRGLPAEPAAVITFDAAELYEKVFSNSENPENFWQQVFASDNPMILPTE